MQVLQDRRGQPDRPDARAIAMELRERFSLTLDATVVQARLNQLREYGDVEEVLEEPGAALTLAEYVNARRTWSISAVGDLVEQAARRVDDVGQELHSFRDELWSALDRLMLDLKSALAEEPPDARRVAAAFGVVHQTLRVVTESGRGTTIRVSRDLRQRDQVSLEVFTAFKADLLTYLTEFREDLRRVRPTLAESVRALREYGTDQLIDLVVSGAPLGAELGVSRDELLARQRERVVGQWREVEAWLAADSTSPLAEFDRFAIHAVELLLKAASELIERRSRRLDRSAEYVHLATLFAAQPDDTSAHALYNAALGLWGWRHLSGTLDAPEAYEASESWWLTCGVAEIDAALRSAVRTSRGGRPAKLRRHTRARELGRRRRAAEQAELEALLARLGSEDTFQLSDLGELTFADLRALSSWLFRALSRPPARDGARRARGGDGQLELVIRDDPYRHSPQAARVRLICEHGALELPDLRVSVSRT